MRRNKKIKVKQRMAEQRKIMARQRREAGKRTQIIRKICRRRQRNRIRVFRLLMTKQNRRMVVQTTLEANAEKVVRVDRFEIVQDYLH